MKKKIFVLTLISVVSFLSSIGPVRAGVWQAGETLVLNTVLDDDLYAAGSSLVLGRPVSGDAYIVGAQVSVAEPIAQDLVAAAGTISVSQSVGDDARLVGGTIVINSAIADDLVITGGSILIDRQATIGGDLVVAGGSVTVHGTVKGVTKMYGGQLIFSGVAEGPADLRAEELSLAGTFRGPVVLSASSKFEVTANAAFYGPVMYYQPGGVYDFGASLQNGVTAEYRSDLAMTSKATDQMLLENVKAVYGFWSIMTLLSALLIMILIIVVAPHITRQASAELKRNPWANAGKGLLYYLLLPIIALLLFISLVGIPLGLLTLGLYGATLMLAKSFTAVLMAGWAELYFKAKWSAGKLWLVSVAMYLTLRLLVFVPILGWLVITLLVLAATGALIQTKWKLYRSLK